MRNTLRLLPATLLAAASIAAPLSGTAGNLMNPYPPAFCGFTHCNSLTETKLYQVGNPVVFQTYAKAGECLKVWVTDTGGNDVELVIISPSLATFSTDANANNFEGLRIRNLSSTGSYTIVFGHWLGGGVGSRATVDVGRYYSSDGVNCPASASRPASLLSGGTVEKISTTRQSVPQTAAAGLSRFLSSKPEQSLPHRQYACTGDVPFPPGANRACGSGFPGLVDSVRWCSRTTGRTVGIDCCR